ncbi:MAG: phage portal protein [Celeribacter sp.]|jgi:HK97 family phage portal protein
MGIFDRFRRAPEVKESAGYRLHYQHVAPAVWSKRNYAAFADEAYIRNVVAYRAIKRIEDAVASVPWMVWQGDEELTTHPLKDLLATPNPSQGGSEFWGAMAGFYMIAGNAYLERVLVQGTPKELWTLRPDRMKVLQGETGLASGYLYKVGQQEHRWDADPITGDSDVRHLKAFHPVDDWYGLSPVEAGAYSVDQHNESMSWMQALLQNSARPSGALAVKDDRELSDDQFNRLKVEVQEQYSGSKNAGRPMILEGGLQWQAMGLSPSDMGIIEGKHSAARDVCLAFGVPPQLLGIPGDNTYSNYAEARQAFWEDTVIPLVKYFASEINAWLSPYFEGAVIKPDFDQIEAIAEKRREMWAMGNKSMELTVDEVREMKGYEPLGGEKGKMLMADLRKGQPKEPDETPSEKAWRIAYG